MEYGVSESYGQISPLSSELVTNHSAILRDLKPGITYHYRVVSRDAAGNEVTSEKRNFTILTFAQVPKKKPELYFPTSPAEQISSIGDILKNADMYMGKEVTIEGIITGAGTEVEIWWVPDPWPPGPVRHGWKKEVPYVDIKDSTGEIRVLFESLQVSESAQSMIRTKEYRNFIAKTGLGVKIRVIGIVEKEEENRETHPPTPERMLIKGISCWKKKGISWEKIL